MLILAILVVAILVIGLVFLFLREDEIDDTPEIAPTYTTASVTRTGPQAVQHFHYESEEAEEVEVAAFDPLLGEALFIGVDMASEDADTTGDSVIDDPNWTAPVTDVVQDSTLLSPDPAYAIPDTTSYTPPDTSAYSVPDAPAYSVPDTSSYSPPEPTSYDPPSYDPPSYDPPAYDPPSFDSGSSFDSSF